MSVSNLDIVVYGTEESGKNTLIEAITSYLSPQSDSRLKDQQEFQQSNVGLVRGSVQGFKDPSQTKKGSRALTGSISNQEVNFQISIRTHVDGVEDLEQFIHSLLALDLAIVLIDITKGLDHATRRLLTIFNVLGGPRLILALNKLDLVDQKSESYLRTEKECRAVVKDRDSRIVDVIPISAHTGANVTEQFDVRSWYKGPTLMEVINSSVLQNLNRKTSLRVCFGHSWKSDKSGLSWVGYVESGVLRVNQQVMVFPSKRKTTVTEISNPVHLSESNTSDAAIVFRLQDPIEAKDASVLGTENDEPHHADQFAGYLVWLDAKEMLPERTYRAMFGRQETGIRITELAYRIDLETGMRVAAQTLHREEIAYCKFSLDRLTFFDTFEKNRSTGYCSFFDQETDRLIGLAMIKHPLRRSSNIVWHDHAVTKQSREELIQQRACVVWLTGLSASGKSTIADHLEILLRKQNKLTYLLDGDNVRQGLNRDLGFTDHDRVENIRRVAEVAKLMVDAGLIVIVSFISPFKAERAMARKLMGASEFIEVFVDTPLAECERRDPKGLYRKVRRGELQNFTGIDSPYETPESPDIRIDTLTTSPAEAARTLADYALKLKRKSQ